MKIPFDPKCRWIWLRDAKDAVNQYVCFRKFFCLPKAPRQAWARIAVDSDYQLFINGIEVWGRQFSDYPHYRSFNRHSVARLLKKGVNVMAILAYHRGQDSSEYRKGKPGLLVDLQVDDPHVVSDRSWQCRLSPSFQSGNLPKVTGQMGFTVQYDARKEDDWITSDDESIEQDGWSDAEELAGALNGYWKGLLPRPLSQLTLHPFHPGRLVAEGSLIRKEDFPAPDARAQSVAPVPGRDDSGTKISPAMAMAAAFKRIERCHSSELVRPGTSLVLQPANDPERGSFLLFDLGREEVGLLHFSIDAPENTVVDIAHGEHLDDLGVRALVGGRQFADRYICRAGPNEFTLPFRRLGCRYLELHFSNFQSSITVYRVGLRPVSYPLQVKGEFNCADALLKTLRITAIRTLELCMHEHYEDCPWREQSLYAFDSRNQALYGYYAFGEYRFPEESFRLLGWSLREDGLLELSAPARVPITIPIFSLVWICALRDHFLFSGREKLFAEFQKTIEKILTAFLARPDEKTGLYRLFDGEAYWTFYEWAPGLDYKKKNIGGNTDDFHLDAPHNLFLIEAMAAYCDIQRFAGNLSQIRAWETRIRMLRKAVHQTFWEPKHGCYATFTNYRRRWHYCELTQALAMVCGLGSTGLKTTLVRHFGQGDPWVPMTLSSLLYGARAMINANLSQQTQFIEYFGTLFSSMLFKQATSLWETIKGGDDFANAGSLCHGWSALPAWITHAYILGIEPATPAFETFRVHPHLVNLPWASGKIPTPHGPIMASWERNGPFCNINITAPKSCRAVFEPIAQPKLAYRCFFNGRKIRG